MGSPGDLERNPGRRLIFRPSRIADIHHVAANIRPADREEIRAATGAPPLKELGIGYTESRPCLTAADSETDEAVVMFGVVPTSAEEFPRFGVIWLIATTDIVHYTTQFLRESKPRLAEVCRGYTIVGNLIDDRNALHALWLRWLGFSLIKKHPEHGVEKRPFTEFVKIVEDPNV